MARFEYLLVDVFTNRQFGGNPLAVFPEGQAIPEDLLQRITKELNLSEAAFVMPPRNDETDFHVRIFTPGREVPMAGHPTVGTAFALAHLGHIQPIDSGAKHTHFEEGVGTIPVELSFENGKPTQIVMDQPLPTFEQPLENRAEITAMLNLSEDDLADLPIQVVSTGVPFLYIPLKSLDSIERASLRMEVWRDLLEVDIFLLTPETVEPTSTVHSRMFAPTMNISEDPATGAASGPLGAYLVEHGVVTAQNGVAEILSEQGFEMGRPSYLHIAIGVENQTINRVRVGGECVMMGGGYFEIDI